MTMYYALFSFVVIGLIMVQSVNAQDKGTLPTEIGMSLPLSGPRAASGQQMKAGAEACLSAAGVNIRLETRDDGGVPERAVANIRAMAVKSNILLMLGGGDANVTAASLPILNEAQLPMVCAATGAESVRKNETTYLFHARASHTDESKAITTQLYELGIVDIAVVYVDSPFGLDGLDGMRVEASRLAIRLLPAALPVTGSFDSVVKFIAEAAPSAVVLIAPHAQAARFIRNLSAVGVRPRFFGLSVVSAEQLGVELGVASRGIGVSQVIPFPWGGKLELVRDYQAALKAHGSSAPGYDSLEGCIYARIGAEAIKRAGRGSTRAKVYAALYKGTFDLGGHVIRFNGEDRRGTRFVEMTVIGTEGRITR